MSRNAGRGELNHFPACQGPGDTWTLRNHLPPWPQPTPGPRDALGRPRPPAHSSPALSAPPGALRGAPSSPAPQSGGCVEDTPHPSRPLVEAARCPPPVQALGAGRTPPAPQVQPRGRARVSRPESSRRVDGGLGGRRARQGGRAAASPPILLAAKRPADARDW